MHIKIDEDLPQAVAQRLRQQGYSCSTVSEQGMGGWKDPRLWQAVQDHHQFLITADKGFGDIRKYPPGGHAGVLLLRPLEDGIRPLLELIELVLSNVSNLESLQGLLAVASPQGLRIKRQTA
jgi:predicted nuclease of predicted toxin-antitoxin system